MIVDSSAVFSLLHDEASAEAVLDALSSAQVLRMSSATWVEVGVVAIRRAAVTTREVDDLLGELGVDLVSVDATQARIAREAYRRFGPNSGSRARLNFGDCFSYALAITTGEPLLYVGEDFTHTDVRPAL